MTGLESSVVGLAAAYVLLSAILLVVLVRLPIRRLFKIAAILAASAAYVAVFFTTQGLLGWSAPVAVPARFQVLWTRVLEPNPSRGQPGAVHLWLEELDDSNLPSGVPRAYLLPYSPELAGRVSAAQAEIEKSHPQGGRSQFFGAPLHDAVIGPVNAGAPPGGDPSGGGLLDPEFLGGQSKSVDLIPLPRPVLPPKNIP
ncbi:MAG: hypothetical protein JF625_10320 [Inquilinus limosus]|uniref:Uncharacterized protein n=1 Tax=Inquilinus limosus TaxID=171674 RepID=A0A952FLT0_9PROT|nr:hypothetical protein [Inquilinus limosus]